MTAAVRRLVRRTLVAACLVGWVSCAGTSGASDSKRSSVAIVATGEDRTTQAVEVILRELLARLPVEWTWSLTPRIAGREVLAAAASDSAVSVRVWMDLSDDRRAKIYAVHVSSDRFIVRVIPLEHGYDEVAREALVHIVESAVDAFLAGGDVGATREVAEEQVRRATPETTGPASPSSKASPDEGAVLDRHRLTLTVAYEVTAAADPPVFFQGPGVAVTGSFGSGRSIRFVASASARYRVPFTWDAPSVGTTLQGGTLRITVGGEAAVGRTFVLRALAGAGPDATYVRPHALASGVVAAPPFWEVAPVLTALANADVTLLRRLALELGLGFDFDVSHTRYDLTQAGQSTHVLSPWQLHPFVYLGPSLALD
jgi:hypothetical protein